MEKKSPVEFGIHSQEHPEKFPFFPSKRLFPTQYPGKASPPCGYLEFFLVFFFNPKQTTPGPSSEFRGCFPMNPCAGSSDIPEESFPPWKLLTRIRINWIFPRWVPATGADLGMGPLCFIPDPWADSQTSRIQMGPKVCPKWERGKES